MTILCKQIYFVPKKIYKLKIAIKNQKLFALFVKI